MFDVNWEARSHAEIFSQLQGGGSGFSEAGGAWNQLASRLRQVAGSVEQATQGITATRSGAAADAARGAVGPMGTWADQARAFSDAVGSVSHEQSRALASTRAAVPPPAPATTRAPVTRMTWEQAGGLAAVDADLADRASLDAERAARSAMVRYQDASALRSSALPRFDAPPGGAPQVSVVPAGTGSGPTTAGAGGAAAGTGVGGGEGGAGAAGGSGAGAGGTGAAAPGLPGAPGPVGAPTAGRGGATPGTGAAGAAAGGAGTPGAGGATPGAGGPGAGGAGPGGAGAGGSGTGAGGGPGAGGTTVGGGLVGGAAPGRGGVGAGGSGGGGGVGGAGDATGGRLGRADAGPGDPAGAGRAGPVVGNPGSAGGTESQRPGSPSPGDGVGGRPALGPGPRAGAGGPILESALGGRAATPAAAEPGALPFAPLGGHGGGGATDQRLPRAGYLHEDDPDAIAGELPRVAPPVIGE